MGAPQALGTLASRRPRGLDVLGRAGGGPARTAASPAVPGGTAPARAGATCSVLRPAHATLPRLAVRLQRVRDHRRWDLAPLRGRGLRREGRARLSRDHHPDRDRCDRVPRGRAAPGRDLARALAFQRMHRPGDGRTDTGGGRDRQRPRLQVRRVRPLLRLASGNSLTYARATARRARMA